MKLSSRLFSVCFLCGCVAASFTYLSMLHSLLLATEKTSSKKLTIHICLTHNCVAAALTSLICFTLCSLPQKKHPRKKTLRIWLSNYCVTASFTYLGMLRYLLLATEKTSSKKGLYVSDFQITVSLHRSHTLVCFTLCSLPQKNILEKMTLRICLSNYCVTVLLNNRILWNNKIIWIKKVFHAFVNKHEKLFRYPIDD